MRGLARAVALLAIGGMSVSAADRRAASPDWTAKIHPRVIADAASDSAAQVDCVIYLDEQADLSGAARFKSKAEKGQFVMERLIEIAARTQPAVLTSLGD